MYIVDDGNYDLKGTYKLPKHEDLEVIAYLFGPFVYGPHLETIMFIHEKCIVLKLGFEFGANFIHFFGLNLLILHYLDQLIFHEA